MFSSVIERWRESDPISKFFTGIFAGVIALLLLALVVGILKTVVMEVRWNLQTNAQRIESEEMMQATYDICIKEFSGSLCHGYWWDLKWIRTKNAGIR